MLTFPLDLIAPFEERTAQMHGWGIPLATIHAVAGRVTDSWLEAPGGWAWEWAQTAAQAESHADWLTAALCYGAARFPTACTPYRKALLRQQLACYLRAAPGFPCRFERRIIRVPYRGQQTAVAVHLFSPPQAGKRPLVCLTGGVDTGKFELHRLAWILARCANVTVAAMDMPGTAESEVNLAPDSDVIYRGVLSELPQALGCGRTAIIGLSFGGHWAAKLGLSKAVDAAINIGGPVGWDLMDGPGLSALPNGMTGIVANALGLDRLPTPDEAAAHLARFSLVEQGLLLSGADACPMLVVNGSQDAYIPPADTWAFLQIPAATVWVVDGTSHCAAEKFKRMALGLIGWLRAHLHSPSTVNQLIYRATLLSLPRLQPTRVSPFAKH